MSADPTRQTHPLLYAVVEQHVTYYRESEEYTSRNHIAADLQKDSQFLSILDEAAIQAQSPNAIRAFRRVLWPIVRYYMNTRSGWWARSYGRNASFFHEDWGSPEDCRDALNLRLKDREKDEAALERLVVITETKCHQLGWSFDPQFDDSGALVHCEVWKAVLA